MDLDCPNLVLEANRLNRQAEDAERKGNYYQALDQYNRAATKYRQACENKQHPKCREILQFLIQSIERNAEYVRSYIEKGVLLRTQMTNPKSTINEDTFGVLTKYLDDYSQAVYGILDSSSSTCIAGDVQTGSSELTVTQKSECLEQLNRLRLQFENEINDSRRRNFESYTVTSSDSNPAHKNVRVLEDQLHKAKVALEEAQTIIDSQRCRIDEQQNVIEKYHTQWRQLKERARMKRS